MKEVYKIADHKTGRWKNGNKFGKNKYINFPREILEAS